MAASFCWHLPFAVHEAERQASGAPRPCIAACYTSKEADLERVSQAAEQLVAERYLLAVDVAVCLTQASKFWDYFTSRPTL